MKKKITSNNYISGVIVSCVLLVGCGGDDGINAPDKVAVAPVVELHGVNQSLEKETIEMSAQAEDYDGKVVSYKWQSNSLDIVINGANSANMNFIAPSVEQEQQYLISVTVTDNDNLSTTKEITFKSKPIFKEVTLEGQVLAENLLVYPELTFEIGDQTFTTTGHDLGGYQIDLKVEERNFDKLVKITAIGNEKYGKGIKLVSLMGSFNDIYAAKTSLDYVLVNNYWGLNVSSVSTAEYVILTKLNSGEEIKTQAELDHLRTLLTLDEHQLIASILSIMIDNENHNLPEDVEDTLQLANELANEQHLSLISNLQNSPSLKFPEDETKSLIFDAILVAWGDFRLVENQDLDGDGIHDSIDTDIDGDGYNNDKDFFPRDEELYAPTIGMIDFPDSEGLTFSRIETCIRDNFHYQKSDGKDFGTDDYKEISSLDITELNCLDYNGISFLDSLVYFEKLEVLYLDKVETSKGFDILGTLANLQELIIIDSNVDNDDDNLDNFAFLTSLNNLTYLQLSQTNIIDLSPISDLIGLQQLGLESTKVDSIELLTKLTKLQGLNIAETLVSDLTVLSAMTELRTLYAHEAKIEKLPSFENMPNLNELTLYENNLSDISDLTYLKNFYELDLSNNNVSDISALNSISSLVKLNLEHNQVTSLETISGLTNLVELNVGNNLVNDLKGINAFTKLETLNVTNENLAVEDSISNISLISSLTELINLDLSYNNISDISVLVQLSNLEILNLESNNLTSNNHFNQLTKLTSLNVDKNGLVEFDFISSLNLDKFTLNYNPYTFSSLQPLIDLTVYPEFLSFARDLPTCEESDASCITSNKAFCEQDKLLQQNAQNQKLPKVFLTPIAVCNGFIPHDAFVDTYLYDVFPNSGLSNSTIAVARSAGFNSLGKMDLIACIPLVYNGYPVCYVANQPVAGVPNCDAEIDEQQITCSYDEHDLWEFPSYSGQFWKSEPFTIEMNSNIAEGNKFSYPFDQRLILNILRAQYHDVEFDCIASDIDGLYDCSLKGTGTGFTGEITWSQNFPEEHFPRCSVSEEQVGSAIATCTPGPTIDAIRDGAFNSEVAELNHEYDFEVDFSTITITPVNIGDAVVN